MLLGVCGSLVACRTKSPRGRANQSFVPAIRTSLRLSSATRCTPSTLGPAGPSILRTAWSHSKSAHTMLLSHLILAFSVFAPLAQGLPTVSSSRLNSASVEPSTLLGRHYVLQTHRELPLQPRGYAAYASPAEYPAPHHNKPFTQYISDQLVGIRSHEHERRAFEHESPEPTHNAPPDVDYVSHVGPYTPPAAPSAPPSEPSSPAQAAVAPSPSAASPPSPQNANATHPVAASNLTAAPASNVPASKKAKNEKSKEKAKAQKS